MRPSYVLGGQNMIIAFTDDDIKEYMAIILSHNIENPVLIDKYLMGIELEVDAICDGKDILIPGIMEHVERTGIHSGDSIAVYPCMEHQRPRCARIIDQLHEESLGIAEDLTVSSISSTASTRTNFTSSRSTRAPRSNDSVYKQGHRRADGGSRDTDVCSAKSLPDMGYGTGLYKTSPYVAVKVPVFSFEKLIERRQPPRTGDEVHRRGARTRVHT